MATDKSKIGSGVLLRADGTEMSASPVAESSMQDEGGYVFLRLAIIVERDIISQCGFYTAPEIPGSIVDAMSAIAEAAEGKAIMAAALKMPLQSVGIMPGYHNDLLGSCLPER